MTRTITLFSSLWVFMMVASTADSRVIHKRAAFYIANDTMCIVDGEVYLNGDPVPTDDHCEKCTCRPPGFSCVLRDCEVKPGCKAVRKDGECCPDYICGCSHNGNVYKDGEFIRDLQNPCYTCRCHGSSISCTFADCLFRSDCGPEYIQGECCPRYDHCPPLSTIQKTTTIATTVPITYDKTTMPLFDLTSSPHDRLATHTTIFPTAGTVTLDSETETTATYGTQEHSLLTSEPAQTTDIVDHAVAFSSEKSETPISEVDTTSTVATFDSEQVTEESSQVNDISTQKVTLDTADGMISTSFASDATFSESDVETEDKLKGLTSTSTAEEITTETQTVTEVSDGSRKDHTELNLDEVTMMAEETTVKPDETTVKADETTEKLHETTMKSSVTTAKGDETTEKLDETTMKSSVTTAKGDETTVKPGETTLKSDESAMKPDVTTMKVDETTVKADEITVIADDTTMTTEETGVKADDSTRVTLSSEESLKVMSDITENETFNSEEGNMDDNLVTPTDAVTANEDLKTSPEEDELYSSHKVASPDENISESTTPSPLSTVTLSRDTDTELVPLSAIATTKVHDSSTDEDAENVSENPLTAITSHDDSQAQSGMDDKEIFSSTEHSDFDESTPSNRPSETESHTFSTGSMDHGEYIDGSIDEGEISIQDAEELDSSLEEITSSYGSHHSETTAFEGSTHLPFREKATTQAITSEFTEVQAVSETGADAYTEKTEIGEDGTSAIATSVEYSLPSSEETAYKQDTESVPTHHHIDSRKQTTEQPVHDSSDGFQTEKTVSLDENVSEDDDSYVSSIFAESEREKLSSEPQSTTEHFPSHDHTVNEPEAGAAAISTTQSDLENHATPQILPESDSSSTSLVTGEAKISGELINAENEGSPESSFLVTSEESTESAITMEAEYVSPFTISDGNPMMTSVKDVSETSFKDTESPGPLRGTHGNEPSVTLTSSSATSPNIAPFSKDESTAPHIFEDDLSTKTEEEHGILQGTSYFSSTLPPDQETSDFHEDDDVVTEISSQDSKYSEQNALESTHFEADHYPSTESSTSYANENISENTATVSPTEESIGPDRHDTISLTTGLKESATSPEKGLTDETRSTSTSDRYVSTVFSVGLTTDDFNSAEKIHDKQRDEDSENGINTDGQAIEMPTEITMDAEEIGTDYSLTTENVKRNFLSAVEDQVPLNNEDFNTPDRYTQDGETSDYHLRISRSTSWNGMDSSATAEYPEEPELQRKYTSKAEKESTEGPGDTRSSVSAVLGNTAVTDVQSNSVTESLHFETTNTDATYNTLDSTRNTYFSFEGTEIPSFESDGDISTTTMNTDNSREHEPVANLTAFEIIEPSLGDEHYNVNKTDEEAFKQTSTNEKVLYTSSADVPQTTKPASSLLKDENIAPDLILPGEHHFIAETGKPTPTDGVKQSLSEDPASTVTSVITGIASASEKSETGENETEYFSESHYTNSAIQRDSDEDVTSRFSGTSEKYATSDAAEEDNSIFHPSTESQPTISSFTMDAEILNLDDITERNVGQREEQSTDASSWNTQANSERTNVFEHEDAHSEIPSDSEKEFVGKDFESGPEKGGELFEPTVPVLSAMDENESSQSQTTSDTEKEFIGKDLESGPEKGGELFEQTVPVLSAMDENESGPEKGGELFEPTVPVLSAMDENESSQSQTPSDTEKEFIGKDFESGPEKGGELFEPTVPVLSIIDVHKDKAKTSADGLTTVGYSAATNLKTDVSSESGETVYKTDDQTQDILHRAGLYHSTLFMGAEYGELTTTETHVRDSANSVDVMQIDNKSTVGVQYTTPYEITPPNDIDDSTHNLNMHESLSSSAQEADMKTNEPGQEKSEGNSADTTVSSKFTFSGVETVENSWGSTNLTADSGTDEQFVEAVILPMEAKGNGVEHGYVAAETTTSKNRVSPSRDETESATKSDTVQRDVTKNDELKEPPESDGEPTKHSQHEAENAGSEEKEKKPDISATEDMFSVMDFTDIITEDAEPIADREITTESIPAGGEEAIGLQNTDLRPTVVTRDELYSEVSEEDYKSQNSNVSGHAVKDSGESENVTGDSRLSWKKSSGNYTSTGNYNEDLRHESDYVSSYHYTSATPLPLLFHGLTEQFTEDTATEQSSHSGAEQNSTMQPNESSDIMETESISGAEKVSKDSGKQQVNSDSSVSDERASIRMTLSDVNEHNSIPTGSSEHHEVRKDGVDATTVSTEEQSNQNSYSTQPENLHSHSSKNESEKHSAAKSTQATEMTQNSGKTVPHVLVLRISHDYPPDSRYIPEEKVKSATAKDGENYSVTSSLIVVESQDGTTQEEQDKAADSTATAPLKQEDTEDGNYSDHHETNLGNSAKITNSVEAITTVNPAEKDLITREFSDDVTFRSQSAEDVQNKDGGHLEDGQDAIHGLRKKHAGFFEQ